MQSPPTIMAALDVRALDGPDRVAYTFLRNGETEDSTLTFSGLRRRAIAVAARLTSLGARGERAILLYPQGLEFIVAFLGCLYAGAIAVPTSVPNRKRGLDALRRVVADSGAKWILSTGTVLRSISGDMALDSTLRALPCFDPEDGEAGSTEWHHPQIDPNAVALLQYTSGSTGSPRGVAVRHSNLVDNHQQMQLSFDHDESSVIVSWLPTFHDMGLGTVLMTVWTGARGVLLTPMAFVQNPRRWLDAISRYRATTSLAPDFAYDLCARRLGPSERAQLDLSSWRAAVNGSEPVHASTIDRFSEAFASCGFRREAFQPGYGLAEATLFVTSGHPRESPVVRRFSSEGIEAGEVKAPQSSSRAVALVGCGRPWLETSISIVNPDTREECEPGRVGEIWIRGKSVAAGYWGKYEESAAVFGAVTAGGQAPFLRTGDLGFIDDGQLFVTGRHKDLIIIRGRNHYPQDIEANVSSCDPALVPNGGAVFSIDSEQGEQVVIVQEVERTFLRTLDTVAVIRAIRAVVSDRHALHTHAVVLLKPSTLPRTTSGKIRRASCRRAFVDGSLPAIASWIAPTTPEPETDTHPDSERRAVSLRADRLIDWLQRHAADLISSHATDGRRTIPESLLRDLANQGLLGMQVETQYGGLGLGHVDTVRVLEHLAAFDFALALFIGLNNYLGIQPIAKHAPYVSRALLLPVLARGEQLAAFAFQEPGSSKEQSTLAARAIQDGDDHWRLLGTKYLESVAQDAGIINVFAYHEEPRGLSAFVVSRGVEGLRHLREGFSVGVLGFTRDAIVLDGVRVGRENLLGGLGSGVDIAREAMMHTRLAIGVACVGSMKRCARLVGREAPFSDGNFDGKRTPNPVTLSRLGSLTATVDALECLVNRTARAIDAGHAVPSEAFAACRILGPELLLRAIDDVMQLGFGGGFAETNRILCLYRDAGSLRHFDGPPEAVAECIGAVVMEGDASLRLLVQEVFGAPSMVRWIGPVVEAVRNRMTRLRGPLARRAQRWGHTRAGELTTWLVLLAAVEGSRHACPSTELERAQGWAQAQFEHALSSVRFGTPSETATLDTSDVAATFAAYARTTGVSVADVTSVDHDLRAMRLGGGPRQPAHASPLGRDEAPGAEGHSTRELRSWIVSWLARRVQIPVFEVDAMRSFADHGLDSVASVELAKALSDKLGRELDETLLWTFATIEGLVEYLALPPAAVQKEESPRDPDANPTPRSATQTVESELDDEIARLERKLRPQS